MPVKIILVRSRRNPKSFVILFSTDTRLPALNIIQYYETRFQIEFLFRDAKQHTGFADCQSTKQQSLDSHFNMSLTALNLAKMDILLNAGLDPDTVISIDNYKRIKSNENNVRRIFSILKLDPDLIKIHPDFKELLYYGSLAA